MNILFVTNLLSPYRAKFFSELGRYCNLTVITELDKVESRDKKWIPEEFSNYKHIPLHLNPFYHDDLSIGMAVTNYIRKHKFDFIVFGVYTDPSQLIAIEYCKLMHRKFIISDDGGFLPSKVSFFKRIVKKQLLAGAVAYFTTSEVAKKSLLYYGANNIIFKFPFSSIYEKDVETLETLIPSKESIKKDLGITENKVVVYVGQFIYRKGVDILLQSIGLGNFSDVGFYIIGGEITDEYKQIITKYKINNVKFLPFQSAVYNYYKASDCFVLPTREDVWGLVVNEAVGCGAPVITTYKCLSGTEMIKDGENGYLVPSDDPKALADKLHLILDNPKLREKMRCNNLQLAKKYTIESMAKAHMNFFNQLSSK